MLGPNDPLAITIRTIAIFFHCQSVILRSDKNFRDENYVDFNNL